MELLSTRARSPRRLSGRNGRVSARQGCPPRGNERGPRPCSATSGPLAPLDPFSLTWCALGFLRHQRGLADQRDRYEGKEGNLSQEDIVPGKAEVLEW